MKTPGDRCQSQIDYITINKKFIYTVTNVRTDLVAVCGGNFERVTVMAKVNLKLKKVQRKRIVMKKDRKTLSTAETTKDNYNQLELRKWHQALEQKNSEKKTHVGAKREMVMDF